MFCLETREAAGLCLPRVLFTVRFLGFLEVMRGVQIGPLHAQLAQQAHSIATAAPSLRQRLLLASLEALLAVLAALFISTSQEK